MFSPYISVVVAARNDDHGGNMLGRMRAFADSWIQQAARFGLSSEVIIVEWNPPPGRPSLAKALRWPSASDLFQVRFVGVPPDCHAKFPNSCVPLHQMIAKNVGIRRAAGEFILATNLDIIFSENLMRFLASRTLERGAMYRVDRYDVNSAIPEKRTVEELLQFCGGHTLRVHAREGTLELSSDGTQALKARDIADAQDGIALGRGWFAPEKDEDETFRWIESTGDLTIERRPDMPPTLSIDLETGPSAAGPICLEVLDSAGKARASAQIVGRRLLALTIPPGSHHAHLCLKSEDGSSAIETDPRFLNLRVFRLEWIKVPPSAESELLDQNVKQWRVEEIGTKRSKDWSTTARVISRHAAQIVNASHLHTNAAGDFTLLSRDDWFALRGYPEFPIWPMHVDSLFCYSTYHAGIREVILDEPMRIYHVEHLSGAGWTPEGEEERTARIEAKKVPVLQYQDLVQWILKMRRFNAPMIFNLENWGLGGEALPERRI